MKTENTENIEKYVFKQTIGEGTFGKVKLGIIPETGEKYAIKILNKKAIYEKNELHLVQRELAIIKRFNHDNVIKVFNVIEDDKNYYIIMEYCEKGELFDYIVKKQRLNEEEAALFFYELINGLEHIHSKGVVHRDLKPENLLLTNDKQLKIIDFGLSSLFDGKHLLTTKCGSPSYAAPELIKSEAYDGFKTDVWCCGIILYAMLCGYLPFDGEENKEIFKNILHGEIEYPDWVKPYSISLISKMLVQEPDIRIDIKGLKRSKLYNKGKVLWESKPNKCKTNRIEVNQKNEALDLKKSSEKNVHKKYNLLNINNEDTEFNIFRHKVQTKRTAFNQVTQQVDSYSSRLNEIMNIKTPPTKKILIKNTNKIPISLKPKNKIYEFTHNNGNVYNKSNFPLETVSNLFDLAKIRNESKDNKSSKFGKISLKINNKKKFKHIQLNMPHYKFRGETTSVRRKGNEEKCNLFTQQNENVNIKINPLGFKKNWRNNYRKYFGNSLDKHNMYESYKKINLLPSLY